MRGSRHATEAREEAYRSWRACGRSPMKAVLDLERKGFSIGRTAIQEWVRRFSWKERAARADAEEERAREAVGEETARLLADLERQRAKYERFFEGLEDGGVNNQAIYAYTILIKTIGDVKKKAAVKPDLYAMTPVVMDRFVRFIKAHATEKERAVQDALFDLIDRFFDEVKPDGV